MVKGVVHMFDVEFCAHRMPGLGAYSLLSGAHEPQSLGKWGQISKRNETRKSIANYSNRQILFFQLAVSMR